MRVLVSMSSLPTSLQQKTPRAKRHARGSASLGATDCPRSADAPSKYENSGVHGSDIAPLARRVSSERDSRLTM
ncbi:hypothetical protein E1283_14325 [Streptomyces hainanensis]|uniref:Uncharacterized protein n=1 Tax=Streptomyces hainanensis TaxID=402648 RepID=A0A4R4TC39_9ACTN|nr:hypothetical protein E1283_14325 [Streptomyces hainanensis]